MQRLHCVSHKSQPSAGHCTASITESWVNHCRSSMHYPSVHAMSSKEDQTSFCLKNLDKLMSIRMTPLSLSCLFARVLWSTVHVENYNVNLSVIWCPTNRPRPFFFCNSASFTKYKMSCGSPFRVLWINFMTQWCINWHLMSEFNFFMQFLQHHKTYN